MPTFATPEPISVTVELLVGDIRIAASDRGDTVVEVRPTDESDDCDVQAAQQTPVEYSDGHLLVKTPKNRRRWSHFRQEGSVEVTIELPAGSRLRSSAALATLRCDGRLGECRLSAAAGDIHLDSTGPLTVSTASGDVTVDRVAGHAEVKTASGVVRIAAVDGTAVIKCATGDAWIGSATGDLRVATAAGDITVDHPDAGVDAAGASGDITIGDVARGAVTAKTGSGDVRIGVREGAAAWLDLDTKFGTVRNDLDAAHHPAAGEDTVAVTARTAFGDIVVHRRRPAPRPAAT